jgi:biotin operon repressor
LLSTKGNTSWRASGRRKGSAILCIARSHHGFSVFRFAGPGRQASLCPEHHEIFNLGQKGLKLHRFDQVGQILDFLRQEGNKQHSADELTALLSLEQNQVDQALAELQAAGLASPEVVTGYGGSATMWGLNAN